LRGGIFGPRSTARKLQNLGAFPKQSIESEEALLVGYIF
jgi:hypothetical protein